ncbi:hypothetical protein [Streptomyces halobius]|uniref:Uncharacterized protein n=1 Tax=Streptomyces halobius TaxID=2879846 RepID=A0ABY4MMK2_9ACTN|nr:hypothetical protein [Streptomyces halobius]UQA90515.1 hypothetical protein K9S39_00065 [Streptomyces halobius]UQA97561.1 hypothetical protein K9S39_41985 [Streptomyces halobius]
MTTTAYVYSPADLADASALVRFGCQPRLRPLGIPQYRDLLQRYRLNGPFRDAVDAAADGLDMDLIEAHQVEGLILHPREGSWLSYRLKDHPKLGVKDRLVLGLVHIAIAARAYPTPADLEEESVKRTSLTEVDDFLRRLTDRLREAAVDADGLAVPHAELQAAWRVYAKLPPSQLTPTRQLSQSSTQRVIKEALDWLVDQGMAYGADELGPGHYRLAHRFRVQVREAAATAAFTVLCDLRRAHLAEED